MVSPLRIVFKLRWICLAAALPIAPTVGVLAQTFDESELRGSAPVVAPRTLTERRLDRQRGLGDSASAGQAADRGPALPDPFDEFSPDPETGAAIDRSDVFRDLADDGNAVPVPTAPPDDAVTGDTAATDRAENRNVVRSLALEDPEAATGTLDARTLVGEDLTRDPRAPTDQARAFPGREDADVVFQEQDAVYDPIGLRIGRFDIFPSLEVTGGVTDNTSQSSGGESGAFYRISPEVIANSDWARHQLDVTFRGSFQGFPGSSDDDEPSADLDSDLRLDVGRATTVDLGLTYNLAQEDESNADVAGDTDGILNQTIGVTAGVTRLVGLIGLTAEASADRELFTGGGLGITVGTDGAIIADTDDRSNTEVIGTLRASLENGAVLRPFAEVSAGRREFDGKGDSLGFERDSTILEARGGSVLDLSPKVAGEASVGYRNENVNDGALEDLRGVVFDASLVWSPDRLTLVTLTGTTDFDTTTIAGATGSIVYSGQGSLRRSLRKNLTLDAGLGLSYERFEGFEREDLRTNASLGLTLDLNRNAALTAQYSYDRLDSTATDSDFQSNTIEFGVRIQR